MSDIAKILVFSMFLSILWLIPRLDLALQWMSSHIWQSILIGLGIFGCLIFVNWVIQKRSHRRNFMREQKLKIEKSEGL
ncbi:hypothetical protein [Halalkalibacter akibai]|uniref:Uncharacterized protein n=1 Tax=Halalkalibacter akibai (strain ATCC 43226 / DSM 21942 / CIP 109018 / JCM 9157 / 1139) TaxID=1236973 RepID=W4QYJ4_HALA3|nr:hypothetical protein [Halalkalibacter akibai]GAE36952.1 hypothetical protein JCM9157_4189 [Halalkalibacter akibai JCM 9157]